MGAVMASLAACSGASTGTATPAATPSPARDAAAEAYVALIHNFWIEEQSADEASNGKNLAARVCLGVDPPGTPADLQLVDPAACHERAIALLATHQKFLGDLDRTPAPAKFLPDDQVFRAQIPKTIADLNRLISATQSGGKSAVLQAATAYNGDMYPSVTDALNDVDPSVRHP
ncbi:MAG: hypothetical protein E6I72_01745 [Chloroflexi bacterium]|nr:MAG: hypothetical protein E6I72_01745 [Chloroflexota bacterium]